ncbi:MAG: DUF429 domain-containing protein [Akkermansiaceae bacterium]
MSKVYVDGLMVVNKFIGASDADIIDCASELSEDSEVVIGIDAPFSYNPGGGLRDSDKSLKKEAIAAGMKPGSVMPPTFNRMVYLTLRGVVLTRSLAAISGKIRIVEVHPGASMVLRGAPLDSVLNYKSRVGDVDLLMEWLQSEGVNHIEKEAKLTDHYVDACAAALAAWKWQLRESVWLHQAEPPRHPYDFAC